MFEQFYPILLVFIFTAGLVATMVGLVSILGPRRPTPVKQSTFESGSDPVGQPRQRFSVKFYVLALLFVVFDIEIVFLYPWAVLYGDFVAAGLTTLMLAGMLVFVALLGFGLLYEWKRGALEWD
jgi:NADH-quinone oxidoreductase subunit A